MGIIIKICNQKAQESLIISMTTAILLSWCLPKAVPGAIKFWFWRCDKILKKGTDRYPLHDMLLDIFRVKQKNCTTWNIVSVRLSMGAIGKYSIIPGWVAIAIEWPPSILRKNRAPELKRTIIQFLKYGRNSRKFWLNCQSTSLHQILITVLLLAVISKHSSPSFWCEVDISQIQTFCR